jgi:propionyl-CoA carboxylase alpha chain
VDGEPLVLKVGRITAGLPSAPRGADLRSHMMSPGQAELAALMPEKLPPDTSKFCSARCRD